MEMTTMNWCKRDYAGDFTLSTYLLDKNLKINSAKLEL